VLIKLRQMLINVYVAVMRYRERNNNYTYIKQMLEYHQYSLEGYRYFRDLCAYHRVKEIKTAMDFKNMVFDHITNENHSGNITAFDLGAYQGGWANIINKKYSAQIYLFEPNARAYKKLVENLHGKENFHLYNFGLFDKTQGAQLTMIGDGSNIYGANPGDCHEGDLKTSNVSLVGILDFMKEKDIQWVDTIKINIEGGEYDLLDHLIETRSIKRFKVLTIQFHDWMPKAHKRRKSIRKKLSETHTNVLNYDFIWEKWVLKSTTSPTN